MHRLYTVPDKYKISVRINRDNLSRFITPENCFRTRQYDEIKRFLKEKYGVNFTKKPGLSFGTQGVFVDYFPKYWQMDLTFNPLKFLTSEKCKQLKCPIPKGLDGNSNFLPVELFGQKDQKILERQVFWAVERQKNWAVEFYTEIICGFFSMKILEDEVFVTLKEAEIASDYSSSNAGEFVRSLTSHFHKILQK